MTDNKLATEAGKTEYRFGDLNLQIGMRMQLLLKHRANDPSIAAQHYTILIGYVRDEYVIVKSPMEKGMLIPMREGEQIELRTFTGSLLLAFSTVVQRVFPAPHNYLHLSFPRAVQGTLLRKAVRVRVDMPARLKSASAGIAESGLEVTIRDISVDGVQIETNTEAGDKGSTVKLAFGFRAQPTEEDVQIDAEGIIKAVRPGKPGEDGAPAVHRYGIEFAQLSGSNRVLLQNLVYQVLIESRENIV